MELNKMGRDVARKDPRTVERSFQGMAYVGLPWPSLYSFYRQVRKTACTYEHIACITSSEPISKFKGVTVHQQAVGSSEVHPSTYGTILRLPVTVSSYDLRLVAGGHGCYQSKQLCPYENKIAISDFHQKTLLANNDEVIWKYYKSIGRWKQRFSTKPWIRTRPTGFLGRGWVGKVMKRHPRLCLRTSSIVKRVRYSFCL